MDTAQASKDNDMNTITNTNTNANANSNSISLSNTTKNTGNTSATNSPNINNNLNGNVPNYGNYKSSPRGSPQHSASPSPNAKSKSSKPQTSLFRKGTKEDSPNVPKSPQSRKLAQYKSAYDVTGNIDLADEEKLNEYDHSYGVRDTDSGRIFVVARFEKINHFGAVEQKTLIDRGRENLKVFPKTITKFHLQIYTATFNCGMFTEVLCVCYVFVLFCLWMLMMNALTFM